MTPTTMNATTQKYGTCHKLLYLWFHAELLSRHSWEYRTIEIGELTACRSLEDDDATMNLQDRQLEG